MRSSRVWTGILLAVFWLFGMAGGALAAKDSLVWAVSSKLPTMDIYATTSLNLTNVYYMVSDSLVTRDVKSLEIKPHLVESWQRLDDTTWEFKLRKGVNFQSGNPLTAEDVRYTIMDRILNPELKSRQAPGFKFIKDIKVVDKHTFQLITKAPYPLVLERFYTTFPYDKKWCQKVGEKVIAEKPNGTGAYRLVEWEKGSKAVFVANPDYWRKGLPKIKNVTIRVIPESSTRIAELMNHGVNLISKLDPDKCSMIEEKKGLKVLETPSHRIVFWQFDSMGRAGKTPLTDIRVRKAIWHAIDREKIIDVMFKGHAELLNTCLSPFDFAYDESLKGYEFNPQKAKDLLKEAGYPNGLELDVMYYYPISHQFNQAAMGYLDKVGIKLKMKNYVGNIGQAIKVRDSGKAHDVGNFGWASYMLLDPDGLLPFWFVKSSKKCYTDDPELEKWILEARYSFDKNKRLKLYKKAQKRVIEKAYWMPVLAKKSIYGADSSLLINLNPIETVDVVSAHFE